MSPLYFSVVLPAYNTPPDILRRAIDSVLNQTYPYFELIIVDDGSEPSLEPIVKEYTDERIIFIQHPENRGAGAAHNTGIKASKYDWIAFICHDDEWLPNKLEVCVPYIVNNYPQYKFFFHISNIITDDNDILNYLNDKKEYITGNYYYNYLADNQRIIQTSTIFVHISCFEKYGCYEENGLLIDWDLYLKFSKYIDFYCIKEFLSNYYITPIGITHKNTIMNNANAGNDVLKLFLKWQNEIKKNKEARKSWSIRLNAMAKWYLDKNNKKKAKQLFWLAIKLYPFWRGNYIDIIKSILWSKKRKNKNLQVKG
jgi:glycosyltransferase involved in cell wall biosynthesis